MKSIKLYLLPLFILFAVAPLMAQDDFYNESEKKDSVINEEIADQKLDVEDNYYTESDYYNEVSPQQYKTVDMFENEVEVIDNEEIYSDTDEEKHKRRRNRNVGGEIAAEVIVDVLFHAVFFVSLFWQ